jgi:DNA-directed RNA polymerase specialized sigma subunit
MHTLSLIATGGGTNTLNFWTSVVTLVAEGLVIAGVVISIITMFYRWQKKKDRLEEQENREQIKDEVAKQLETFKTDFQEYFDTRINDIAAGVARTVGAVERNGGSAIPDSLSRIEKAMARQSLELKEVHEHLEELDERVKFVEHL